MQVLCAYLNKWPLVFGLRLCLRGELVITLARRMQESADSILTRIPIYILIFLRNVN